MDFKYELMKFTREGNELKHAWEKLSDNERHIILKEYPFEQSVEELLNGINEWNESLDKKAT
ncbi:hypothetical protein ACE1TF_19465 [Geomicrobium sp. JSM 1781026]|uniref:hypothetical protein n=1 Tax=unclassified Geomicrobium TaxID=2628951 RepID=UPI00045F3EC2|nr:hypothetical protein [Geomicrobium sp. JCM 19039]GAK10625.1 hypothetical protein JCM19039_253 [Geomicrobium sp. JCM 19039]